MIDIHSHIVFGVDDGSANMKESVQMLKMAKRLGIEAIFATPHYYQGLFNRDKAVKNFQELKKRSSNMGVELYLGSETLISSDLPEIISTNKDLTLNGTKYLLLDLPLDSVPQYTCNILFRLHLLGIVPIIAHPERNKCFLSNSQSFVDIAGRGALIQVDTASVIGIYGYSVQKFAKNLIKQRLVHFVASDAHNVNDYVDRYLEAYDQILGWSDRTYADAVFHENAKVALTKMQS